MSLGLRREPASQATVEEAGALGALPDQDTWW